jgi:hypothetical protein
LRAKGSERRVQQSRLKGCMPVALVMAAVATAAAWQSSIADTGLVCLV